MCRDGSDMPPAAQRALGWMLHDIADALAREVGGTADDVVIGPVDFGSPDA
jgi:hypothetical protein